MQEEIRRRWDAAAAGWERLQDEVSAFGAPVAAALVEELDPQPVDEVLELAAGTADLSAALAGRVARVLATDVSPAMVEAASRRALPGVEHEVMDMQRLELPDASFDKVVCRWGYMLVPDCAAAFRETRRVLRPGGRVAFATWAEARRNPWANAFGPSLVERGLVEPPKPGEPGQFVLCNPETVGAVVRAAGFEDFSLREVGVAARFRSWDDYVTSQTTLSTVLREALASVDASAREQIEEESRARAEPFRRNGGYELPGVALVARAS